MTINLSQVFVRYPDIKGAASAAKSLLSNHAKAGREAGRHAIVRTGTPWLAVYAWGNSASPEMAEYLSRALEAQAVWFGLSGRALAYRLRRYHLGRKTGETQSPPELFGSPDPFPLPAYADVEAALKELLAKEGLPERYLYVLAEELAAEARTDPDPDAVAVLDAPWTEAGVDLQDFVHRPPRVTGPGPRTLFDRFDEEKRVVVDELVLRGTWDEARGRSLLELLQSMARRRNVPPGWSYVYLLASSAGPHLLVPLGKLFESLRAELKPAFALAVE